MEAVLDLVVLLPSGVGALPVGVVFELDVRVVFFPTLVGTVSIHRTYFAL